MKSLIHAKFGLRKQEFRVCHLIRYYFIQIAAHWKCLTHLERTFSYVTTMCYVIRRGQALNALFASWGDWIGGTVARRIYM